MPHELETTSVVPSATGEPRTMVSALPDLDDLIRFNKKINQVLAESVQRSRMCAVSLARLA